MSANKVCRNVSWDELCAVHCPEPTASWFPVPHGVVVATVRDHLEGAGFKVAEASYSVMGRNDARMFTTLHLDCPLAHGVNLAAGIRSSVDKTLPLGFCGGSHVMCCGNGAFSSELLVFRKHTKFGRENFLRQVADAVASLKQFQEAEAARVVRLASMAIDDRTAESYILRAYEKGIISHLNLSHVIKEWRLPSFEEFQDRNGWSLYNAFTHALNARKKSNPVEHARLTVLLGDLLEVETAQAE